MNPPHFSVLILSHNKWPMVCQAIESVLAQTHRDLDVLVVDSGACADKIDRRYHSCCLVGVELSEEPKDLRAQGINPGAWVLNRFMPQLKSDWSFYICDDDYLLPTYMEAFARAITRAPEWHCFCTGEIRGTADGFGGLQNVNGVHYPGQRLMCAGSMDRQIDYLQFMHDRWLWEEVRKKFGTAYPEDLSVANHGDGIFMERAVSICPALPVPGIHCVNRRTPFSQFCGTGQ